ncbi:MAG: ribosome biogenesis GTP-binding protein YihA/YsxC [Lachnospiraceae bacterium]|nr:ribosome biogenesis GTP-binding protein YihA/YsxC [Lachnospiraceae bacterium]
MIIKSSELETVCGITSKLPAYQETEIAFAGRSNVGKSTLINGLLNRKNLARTSSQPGKTQTINFYRINDEFYFVDLPGYGYAKVSMEERAKWGPMIERYLIKRSNLKAIFLLIDIRRKPNADDLQMLHFCQESDCETVIILTKVDKVKRSKVQKLRKEILSGLHLSADTRVFSYSSVTKQGRDEILDFVEALK